MFKFQIALVLVVMVGLVGCLQAEEKEAPKPTVVKAKEVSKKVGSEKMSDWKNKSESYWRERLSKEEFRVCRKAGTERAFSGEHNDNKKAGTFTCTACGLDLFDSDTKFDSGTGWPSFYDAIEKSRVELREDNTLFSKRIEVVCGRCGSHLGHVFEDGPKPTGKRYCINSVCLGFTPKPAEATASK